MEMEFLLSEKERKHVVESLSDRAEDPAHFSGLEQTQFIRKLKFRFQTHKRLAWSLFPEQTEFLDESGKWRIFQIRGGQQGDGHSHSNDFCNFLQRNKFIQTRRRIQGTQFEEHLPEDDANRLTEHVVLAPSWGNVPKLDFVLLWPFGLLRDFLTHGFFFDHFRKSHQEQDVGGEGALAQDGHNLVQVITYWANNNRRKFSKIQKFVQNAFPEIGEIETPIKKQNQHTQIAFRSDLAGEQIFLQNMGGGVAQLLMAAVALETTTPEFPIFLEEPETNLHPGAQRYLAERLCEEGRQIFITTHSPTFINLSRQKSVHKVRMNAGRTQITSLNEDTLHAALAEIGARNSDVLMSDAVLFVEGECDLQVLQEWCRIANVQLAGTNTSILVTRSIGRPELSIPLRSDTLKLLALQTDIPHIFLIDSDELSEASRRKITTELKERVHVFKKRELENYLLAPKALKLAIAEKLRDGCKTDEDAKGVDEKVVSKILRDTADTLKHRVLLKRIRSAMEVPGGGFYPRELFLELECWARRQELAGRIGKEILKRLDDHLKKLKLSDMVKKLRTKLENQWRVKENRLALAPGEELIDAVFRRFGTTYEKTTDARRIAKHMRREDLCDEVEELLSKIRKLGERPVE